MKSLILIFIFAIHGVAQTIPSDIEQKRLLNAPVSMQIDTSLSKFYDVKFYGIDLDLDPENSYLAGKTSILFSLNADTDEIRLALAPPLEIDSIVHADYGRISFGVEEQPWIHTIRFPDLQPASSSHLIEIFYQGEPSDEYESIVFSENAGQPHIWTLNQPYGAMYWFPCKNLPNDKADSARIRIRVPSPLFAASNGLLETADTLQDGDIRYSWITRYPISDYLISLSVGDYNRLEETYSRDGIQMQLVHYMYQSYSQTELQQSSNLTRRMLDAFSDLFGIYPFIQEKYGHASFEFGGGMEHQTLSSMGGLQEGLIAHELAHQWFGDAVTCENWQHIWFNEGFATYGEGLWIEESRGTEAFRNWRGQNVQFVSSSSLGSVFIPEQETRFTNPNHVSRIFNYRLSYVKAALVLHMLRYQMGDNAFFEACSTMVQDRFAYATITTEQFKEHLEIESGLDLTRFFDEWVYGQGHPNYLGNFEAEPSAEGWNVQLRLVQESSSSETGFFSSGIEIRFSDENQDTVIRIQPSKNDELFEFDLPFNPQSAMVDPNQHLIIGSSRLIRAPVSQPPGILPVKTLIRSNYPNPFNPSTTLDFELRRGGNIRIRLLDLQGRTVKEIFQGLRPAGYYTLPFEAQNLSSGVYVVGLETADGHYFHKITLLK